MWDKARTCTVRIGQIQNRFESLQYGDPHVYHALHDCLFLFDDHVQQRHYVWMLMVGMVMRMVHGICTYTRLIFSLLTNFLEAESE
jgi:hypothetical protein